MHSAAVAGLCCRYIALMEACWQEDSAARPTFEAVVSALDDMRAVDCAKQGR